MSESGRKQSATDLGFWHDATLEELMAKQGIRGPQSFDDLLGAGAGLWDDDHEFEQFVRGIELCRRGARREEPDQRKE